MTAAAESMENLCYLSDNHIRDCSFEIREGGWTIWREGHKISNIVFGGGFKIYNTRFGGLQIFLHKIVGI